MSDGHDDDFSEKLDRFEPPLDFPDLYRAQRRAKQILSNPPQSEPLPATPPETLSETLPATPPEDLPEPALDAASTEEISQPVDLAFKPDPPEVQTMHEAPRRKRGGQVGNLNAMKHGLYLSGYRIHNSTPFERVQIADLNNMIEQVKQYMTMTFEAGMQQKDIDKINTTLHNLTMASLALTRLITVNSERSSTALHMELTKEDDLDMAKVVAFYQQKLADFRKVFEQKYSAH